MEGRRTDNRHVTVKTQISRDGDPEQPYLVASCDSVCTQLQSWTQALELGQAVSRPSPKELGLVRVEAQSVSGHPSADIDNAVSQLSGCRGGVHAVTMQVQLHVIREGMEGNTVSAHNVHKVGHVYYK